jgi:hypothetical protein
MVWGCMTIKGVGKMCFVNGIMDVEHNIWILDRHLLATAHAHSMQWSGFIFQQDGDLKHT